MRLSWSVDRVPFPCSLVRARSVPFVCNCCRPAVTALYCPYREALQGRAWIALGALFRDCCGGKGNFGVSKKGSLDLC